MSNENNDSNSKYVFGPHLPGDCPPTDAIPVTGAVFLGVPGLPITESHFRSYKEKGKKVRKGKECEGCSISVWTSEEAVEHAREVFSHMKDWYIARAELDRADGVILKTPSTNQPLHCSFWRDVRAQLETKFSIWASPQASAEAVRGP